MPRLRLPWPGINTLRLTPPSMYFKRELRHGEGKAEMRYRDCDYKIITEQERCVAALKFYGGEQSGISLPKPTILLALLDNPNDPF